MSDSLFGTDGIRGRAGEVPLVPEFLERLGRALAARLRDEADDDAEPPRVVIGHDGRESAETIVAAIAEGLVSGGAHVDVVGLAPTPCVAFLTRSGPYGGGVVVSASHNPAEDNGVKLLGRNGHKLADAAEQELEQALTDEAEPPAPREPGEKRRTKGRTGEYVEWFRTEAFPELDLSGRRLLVDCANGAASQIAGRVLRAFGAETVILHDKPDGHNINRGCGALHPEVAARAAVEHGCDFGVSLDGDGDRGILVDGDGRILDGDALLAGLGAHLHERGELPHDTVVATVMSNLALENWLADRGARLMRVQVGDRHVAAAMREGGFRLGGEKSGHLLFGEDHGYRGDGLYTLLRVAEALAEQDADARSFAAGYADLPQMLRNLEVRERRPLERLEALERARRELDEELGRRGRTVVRYSGTELRLRLMVEADEERTVVDALDRLEAAARADGIVAA